MSSVDFCALFFFVTLNTPMDLPVVYHWQVSYALRIRTPSILARTITEVTLPIVNY